MQLFAYNTQKNRVKLFNLNEIDKTKDYDLVFQTGPSIIANNKVDYAAIDSSVNGNGLHYRTSFAVVNDNEFYNT